MVVDGNMDNAATADFWKGWLALATLMLALVNLRLLRVPSRVNADSMLTRLREFRRNQMIWIGKYVMLNAVVLFITVGTATGAFLKALKYTRFMRAFARHFFLHLLPLGTIIDGNRYLGLLRISLQFAAFAAISYPLPHMAIEKDSHPISKIAVNFIRNAVVLSYAVYATILFTFVAVRFTATSIRSMA